MKKARQIGSILLVMLMVLAATGCRPADTPGAEQPQPTETQMQLQGTEATAAPQPNDPTEPDPTVSPSDPSEAPADPQPSESLPTEPEPTEPSAPAAAPSEPVPTDPPATHTHSYAASVVAPTCTAQGYTVHKCACGASYNDTYTAAAGHSYTDVVVAPTTEQQGYTDHICSACGTMYRDSYTDKLLPDPQEIAAAVVKYINQFRAEEGSTQLTCLPGMSQVAQYRSVQLVTNFAHDTADLREALAYYKYGEWIDMTQYGYDESYSYYSAHTGEAIGIDCCSGTTDDIAYSIASGVRASTGHWRYVGSSEYSYIGIGVTRGYSTMFEQDAWFICILVGTTNFG